MSIKDEIKELEDNIAELKRFSAERNIDFSAQITELEKIWKINIKILKKMKWMPGIESKFQEIRKDRIL
jgi:hypothetical protein